MKRKMHIRSLKVKGSPNKTPIDPTASRCYPYQIMKRLIAIFAILFLQAGPMASIAISSLKSTSCCSQMSSCHQEKSCCKADNQKDHSSPLSQASRQIKVEKETMGVSVSFTQPLSTFLKTDISLPGFFKPKTSSLFLTKSSLLI